MNRDNKVHRAPPEIVKYFGDLVEHWEQFARDYIYIKLRNMNFDDALIRTIPVGLDLMVTDVKYSFACDVEIVPEDKMNDEHCELYRKLKSFECNLIWKGRLWKKGYFDPISDELQDYIPQIIPSDELIKILHANRDLMKLINKVKPEELNLRLYAGTDITKPIQSIEGFFKLQADFYRNPLKITWIMRLTEGRYVISMNPYKLTSEVCLLLNLIAKELRGLVHRSEW